MDKEGVDALTINFGGSDDSEEEKKQPYSLPELLDHIGFGKFQVFLVFAFGMAYIADAFELLISSYILSLVKLEFGLTSFEESFIVSISFVGFMIGSFSWGFLADSSFGRLKSYVVVLISLGVVGCLHFLSFNVVLFAILRLCMGVAVGGVFVGYNLLAEFLPSRRQSVILIVFQGFFTVGSILGAILSWVVLEKLELSWRMLICVGTVIIVSPALSFAPFLPESVRFLSFKGDKENLKITFLRVARWNGCSINDKSLQILRPNFLAERKGSFFEVFGGELRNSTFLLLGLWFSASFVYYGVVFFIPIFVTSSQHSDTFLMTMLVSAATEIPFLALGGLLCSRFGCLITISLMFLLVSLFILGIGFWSNLPIAAVLTLIFCARGASSAVFAVLSMFTTRIYPTSLRGRGYGLCNAFSRVAGILTPLVGIGLANVAVWIPLALYGSASGLSGIAIWFLRRRDIDLLNSEDE